MPITCWTTPKLELFVSNETNRTQQLFSRIPSGWRQNCWQPGLAGKTTSASVVEHEISESNHSAGNANFNGKRRIYLNDCPVNYAFTTTKSHNCDYGDRGQRNDKEITFQGLNTDLMQNVL